MSRKSFAVAIIFVLAACGDSSGPAGPSAMTIAGGNSQTGPSGGNPPLQLRVRVTGSSGNAFAGAQVTWAVTAGSGSVAPTTSTTDAAGEASTTVTLGSTGPMQVRASVTGVTPVTFALTAVPPCAYVAPFRLDTTVTGVFSSSDCADAAGPPIGTTYLDFYGLATSSQAMVTFTLRSADVDTYLFLWNVAGSLVGVDDDGGQGTSGTDSRIKALLRADAFEVWANTYDSTTQFGSYTLASASTAATVAGCENVWLTGAVVLTETVSAGDCRADAGGGVFYYSDAFLLVLLNGQAVTFTHSSQAFDAYLRLYRFDPDSVRLVAQNDNASGTDAQIAYGSAQNAFYVLEAATALSGATGAYTLTVGAISGAPPAEALRLGRPPLKGLDPARLRLGGALRRP